MGEHEDEALGGGEFQSTLKSEQKNIYGFIRYSCSTQTVWN